ncbi:b101.1 [miniopterid betaherpesvirus 1]|uniref:B101.1 n=1 Tax=miniopterid betaherpesvirus 1 TaxID=3070189 RepID=I3VQ95_9BETA|nr:b101.1 [miniopterid betaherpesvirus 1]AFK83939.1 b101.1 [miniopterid betaherpesvirus 1]
MMSIINFYIYSIAQRPTLSVTATSASCILNDLSKRHKHEDDALSKAFSFHMNTSRRCQDIPLSQPTNRSLTAEIHRSPHGHRPTGHKHSHRHLRRTRSKDRTSQRQAL